MSAARRIAAFAARHGALALDFAAHAALPVALDAGLVHLIRINFFSEPPRALPYAAEADLLLSGLCDDVGDDLYEMRPAVRASLLARLDLSFSRERARELALLIWRYDERHTAWSHHARLRRAQQLTALSFLAPALARAWLDMSRSDARAFPESEEAWRMAMRDEVERADAMQRPPVLRVDLPPRPSLTPSARADDALEHRWLLVRADGRGALAPPERDALLALGAWLAADGWSLVLLGGGAALAAVGDGYLDAMVACGVLRAGGARAIGAMGEAPALMATLSLGGLTGDAPTARAASAHELTVAALGAARAALGEGMLAG